MKRVAITLLLLFPAFQAGCTQPRDLYKSATISMVDSTPCFSVEDSTETRRAPPEITALTVLRELNPGSEIVWAVDLTEAEPPRALGPENCLRYGAPVPGTRVVEAARPLQPGEHYFVTFNAFIEHADTAGNGWENRVYRLNFCIAVDAEGELEAREVPWRNGSWAWQVCD